MAVTNNAFYTPQGVIFGDGTTQTSSYSNTNVEALLPVYTGNISAANISTTGNITASLFIGDVQGNISGNLSVPGSNTQVIFNSNDVAAADSGFTYTQGTQNLFVANTITANYFDGNGSSLSSITGANVTGTVANATYSTSAGTVTTNAQPNITSVGTLTSLDVNGNVNSANVIASDTLYANNLSAPNGTLTILSNLDVKGNVTYIESNVVTINDVAITLANNASNATQANGGGFIINGANASFTFNAASNNFVSTQGITTNANISAGYFIGDGSLLSNIQVGNIVGAYSNANVANYLPTYSGNVSANYFSGDGSELTNISGSNVTGIVPVASTVSSNAQSNITSVGTLTSLTVSGNITAQNSINVTNGVTANTANITAIGYSILTSANASTQQESYTLNIASGATGSLSISNVRGVEYTWIAESTDGTSASMSKGFLVANSSNVSVSNYGLSQVGSALITSVGISGTSSSVTFNFGPMPANANVILTTTQYLV